MGGGAMDAVDEPSVVSILETCATWSGRCCALSNTIKNIDGMNLWSHVYIETMLSV